MQEHWLLSSELGILSDLHNDFYGFGYSAVDISSNILGPNYKKILRLSYDVIITYDNRKSNLR